MALYRVNLPKFSSHNGCRLGFAKTQSCAGLGTEGHPFLGFEDCGRTSTLGFVHAVMDLLLAKGICWTHGTSGCHQTPSASENPGLGHDWLCGKRCWLIPEVTQIIRMEGRD